MSKKKISLNALNNFTKTPIIIDENMEDFSNHPVFVKRSEQAAEFIAKNGLPGSFKTKPKAKKKRKA